MERFIHVRSKKFPVLPGEEQELINDGMYGKALAQYLREQLVKLDYDAPFECCEDWGWWVELRGAPYTVGVCIYCGQESEGILNYFVSSSLNGGKVWSWKKFRLLDTSQWNDRLFGDLVQILQSDPEVEVLATDLDGPI